MDAIKQIYTHLNLRGNQIIGLRPEVSAEDPDYIEGGIYYNPARKTFYGGVSGAWTPFGVSQNLLDKIDTLLGYWSLENGVLKTDYPMMARGYAAGATASVGEGGGGGGAILNKESIITALGYTPYDSANPEGYITVSALTGYATQDYVKAEIGKIDLTAYAKTEDIAKIYAAKTDVADTYATKQMLATTNLNVTSIGNRVGVLESYFATSEDADTQINKWNEIVSFLDATEGTTLAGILAAYTLKTDFEKEVERIDSAYLPLIGGTVSGPLTISVGSDQKLILNSTDGEYYNKISVREDGEEYGELLFTNNITSIRGFGNLVYNSDIVLTSNNIRSYTAGDSLMLDGMSPTSYLRHGDQLTSNVDANELHGMTFHINTTGNGSGNTNMPVTYGYLLNLCNSVASDAIYYKGVQISFGSGNVLQFRRHWGYAWQSWKTIIHSDNVGEYALPIIEGVPHVIFGGWPNIEYYNGPNFWGRIGFSSVGVAAVHDTSVWRTLLHSGNIGNYALKTDGSNVMSKGVLFSDRTLTEGLSTRGTGIEMFKISNGGSASPTGSVYFSILHAVSSYAGLQLAVFGGGNDNSLYYRKIGEHNTWSDWKTIAFTDSNVASAQALKHSNGTTGASVNSDGSIGFAGHLNIGTNAVCGVSAKSILQQASDGRLFIGLGSSTLGYNTIINGNDVILRYGTSNTTGLILNSSGNVTIGDSDLASTTAKLYVDGGISIASGYTLKIGDATISYVNGVLKVDKPFMSKGYAAGATASVSSSGGGVILNKDNIIEALGYTPYDAANPSNYTTRSAIFTGSASQFLKADGSVDSTAYLSTEGGTLTGELTLPRISIKTHRIFVNENGDWRVTDANWQHEYYMLHSGNYTDFALSLSGGQMTGDSAISWGGGASGIWGTDNGLFLRAPLLQRRASDGSYYTILDSGNYSDYALPRRGGTVEGPLNIDIAGYPFIRYYSGGVEWGLIGFSDSGVAAVYDETTWRTLLHSGNIGSYALPLTGGTISGNLVTTGGVTINSRLLMKSYIQFNQYNGDKEYLLGMTTASSSLQWYNGSAWKNIAFTDSTVAAANKLVDDSGAARVTLDSSGKVIVGGAGLSIGGFSEFGNVIYANAYGNGRDKYAAILINKGGDRFGIGPSSTNTSNISFGVTSDILGTWKSEFLTFNSSGNVLIGKTTADSSGAKLQVDGKVSIGTDLVLNGRTAIYTNSASSHLVFGSTGVVSYWRGSEHIFQSGASYNTAMFINSSGNVGIGTTSPAQKLEVEGNIMIPNYSALMSRSTGNAAVNLIYLGNDDIIKIGNNSVPIKLQGAVTLASKLNVGGSTYLKGTHFNGHTFFNSGGEGIYISNTGQSINWHDADNAHVRTMMGFASDNITIHRDLLPSATGTYNLGSSDYRWSTIYGVNGNFSGTLAVTGATTLANTLTARNIHPNADNTYNLGDTQLRWKNLYCNLVYATGLDADGLYIYNGIYSEGDIYSEVSLTTGGDVWAGGFLEAVSGVKISTMSLLYSEGAMSINASIEPSATGTYNLGGNSARWNNLYCGAIWTSEVDTDSLYVNEHIYSEGEIMSGAYIAADGDVRAAGFLETRSGIKIGDATITWDAANGVLKINKPIMATGYAAGATATAN